MEEKRYPHINKALRHDLDRLLEDCFGDLPITAQRLLKAYCMRYDKASCVYRERKVVIHENMPELRNLQVNVDERHFSPCLEQVQVAQETVDNIVNKFKKGKSRAARHLRYVLKDKKIKVSVQKSLSPDASYDGYNPVTKEIYIDLTAGCFYGAKECPKMINEDALAETVGHELGHFIEWFNRGANCEKQKVSSNRWEIESFCDLFGCRLATDAGYSLLPCIESHDRNRRKGWEPKQPNPHPPLKNRLELFTLCNMIFAENSDQLTFFDEKIRGIEWDTKKIENNQQINPKNMVDEKKTRD